MLIRNCLFFMFLCLLVVVIFGCTGTAILNLNYQPTATHDSLLASVSPVKIKVMNFEDKRKGNAGSNLIGGRHAAFGTPMGDVYSEKSVIEIIQNAVKTELAGNNHLVVDSNEDYIFKGSIINFRVMTDVTMTYWDVIGEVSIQLEVIDTRKGSSNIFGPYSAKNVDRTYLNPSTSLMEKVLNASLGQVMNKMISDGTLIKLLKDN